MDFTESSFFKVHGGSQKLPSSAVVLQRQRSGTGGGVAVFAELNLAVKYYHYLPVRLEEAQTMWALRKVFPHNEVPVPEVFGWRKYEGRTFIYMSLVDGESLQEAWPSCTAEDKESICVGLQRIVKCLQEVKCSLRGDPIGTRTTPGLVH